jgi:hypothetical protein
MRDRWFDKMRQHFGRAHREAAKLTVSRNLSERKKSRYLRSYSDTFSRIRLLDWAK